MKLMLGVGYLDSFRPVPACFRGDCAKPHPRIQMPVGQHEATQNSLHSQSAPVSQGVNESHWPSKVSPQKQKSESPTWKKQLQLLEK